MTGIARKLAALALGSALLTGSPGYAEDAAGPDAIVRRVAEHGRISFRNQPLRVSKAFVHQRVALRPTLTDGVYDVFFCHQRIRSLDLRHAQPD